MYLRMPPSLLRVKHAKDVGNGILKYLTNLSKAYLKINRRNNRTLHTLSKHPPSVEGDSWLKAVGSLLLARGIFEGAVLSYLYTV